MQPGGVAWGPMLGPLLGLLAFGLFSVHDALAKALLVDHSPFLVVAGIQTATAVCLWCLWRSTAVRRAGSEACPPSMEASVDAAAVPAPAVSHRLERVLGRGLGGLAGVHGLLVLRMALAASSGVCGFTALSLLPLSAFYTVVFCMPVVAAVFSALANREVPTGFQWAVMALALCGVWVAFPPQASALQVGHAWAFGAVLSSAAGVVVTRRIGRRLPTAVVALAAAIGSALVGWTMVAWGGGWASLQASQVSLWGVAGLVLVGGVTLAIANLALTRALQAAPVSAVMPMQYTQWVWGMALGWMFWQDVPLAREAVGAAIVALAGLVLLRGGIVFRRAA